METSRVKEAQRAFEKMDIKAVKKAHTKEAIAQEYHGGTGGEYIKDMVYDANDGIITTFAVVSGVAGASLPNYIVLILGFANLFADAFSMGVGNYLGTKSELEYIKKQRLREEWEIENYPRGEVEEIRDIYRKKGFKGKDLERAVKVITSNKNVWVDAMMADELGLYKTEHVSPFKKGLATFVAFVMAGFAPLAAYIIPNFGISRFSISLALTAIIIFAVGSLRTLVTGKKWYIAGLEMLLVAGLAAFVAYYVGYFLKGLAGVVI